MTPHAILISELKLVLANAEASAAVFRAAHKPGTPFPLLDLEDHRAAVLGQLLDAIDIAEPGLGTALQRAMYPLTTPTT
jgi:hypothetical protein